MAGCHQSEEVVEEVVSTSENGNNGAMARDMIVGKVVNKKAYNKAGKEMPGSGDYFLEYDGNSTFIKLSESKVTAEDLNKILGQQKTFEVVKADGLWDTDDPNVQSRIGEYFMIYKILD